jgi:hypothetical protein
MPRSSSATSPTSPSPVCCRASTGAPCSPPTSCPRCSSSPASWPCRSRARWLAMRGCDAEALVVLARTSEAPAEVGDRLEEIRRAVVGRSSLVVGTQRETTWPPPCSHRRSPDGYSPTCSRCSSSIKHPALTPSCPIARWCSRNLACHRTALSWAPPS